MNEMKTTWDTGAASATTLVMPAHHEEQPPASKRKFEEAVPLRETPLFRPMRRRGQMLSDVENREILKRNTVAILALLGDNDYSYAVPLNYVYDETENCVYFHGAPVGHKIDAIRAHPKVSMCLIDQDEVLPEKYTTLYRSVIAFGQMEIIEDKERQDEALKKLGRKYVPESTDDALHLKVSLSKKPLVVLKLHIESMTGFSCIRFLTILS